MVLGLSAPTSASEKIDPALMSGLGEAHYHRLESEILGRGFHLFVRLPESYGDRPEFRFPVAVLLDGGTTFPLLAAYYRYLSLAGEVPDMVLVGLGYGAERREDGNMRGTDFTAESAEREHYGGAPRFLEVLRRELLPLIEDRYRVDPRRRILFGQSLGGQFVIYSASAAPDLFWGHIASNPALHRNLELFLRRPAATDSAPVAKLFVASA